MAIDQVNCNNNDIRNALIRFIESISCKVCQAQTGHQLLRSTFFIVISFSSKFFETRVNPDCLNEFFLFFISEK